MLQKLLKQLRTIANRAAVAAVTYYRRNPARCNSYIAAAAVAACSALGLVVDPQSVGRIVVIVLPILLGGEATHRLVTPAR